MFGEHIEQQRCVNLELIAVTDMTADEMLRGLVVVTALHQTLGSVLWEVGTLPTVRLIMPARPFTINRWLWQSWSHYLFILPSSNWVDMGNILSLLFVSITSN